jgi:Asp-tRNA(Asn)/Glu-tRNA(Gln) amidotransferase A subunit family amidase
VIPLADRVTPTKPLEFDPDLLGAQPVTLPGRFHSSADYTTLYKSGTLTPLQVIEGLLPLISDRARSDHGKAWAEIHADEVRAAAKASSKRWAEGKPLGPLDGVPFGVKCDTEMTGFVRTLGLKPDVSRYPEAFRTQERTAWCVEKLLEAGAIPLGTLMMHELGIGEFFSSKLEK